MEAVMNDSVQVKQCRWCNVEGPHDFFLGPFGPHYAKLVCVACGRQTFVQKPETEKRQRRHAAHRDLVEKYGKGYCELCLMPKLLLRKYSTLMAHHVLEYDEHDGDASRENIWIVCTDCHAEIHRRREYVKHLEEIAKGMASWKETA